MYTQFYQLDTLPFSIAPNPKFLYLTKGHQAVLSELEDAIYEQVALSVLFGEVGTGKTTLSRALLEDLPPELRTALILNPRLTPAEFLQSIFDELQVDYQEIKRSIRGLRNVLRHYVEEQESIGHRLLVIVDEAQQLQPGVLELIESLILEFGALETPLSFILVGQPELDAVLNRPRHQELYELTAHRCRLYPMTFSECQGYIAYRLEVAGLQKPLFTPRALGEIHQLSSGIPRLINLICDRTLLLGYASNMALINSAMVKRASAELKLIPAVRGLPSLRWINRQVIQRILGATLIIILMASVYLPIQTLVGNFPSKMDSPPFQINLHKINVDSIEVGALMESAGHRMRLILGQISEVLETPFAVVAHKNDANVSPPNISESNPEPIKLPPPEKVDTPLKTENDKQASIDNLGINNPTNESPPIIATEIPSVAEEPSVIEQKPVTSGNTPGALLGSEGSVESKNQQEIPEFLLWVKQGVEPLADRVKFSEWISDFSMSHREGQFALFKAWIPSLPDTSLISCVDARELDMVCGHFWGQWSLLKEINLPAILEIRLSDGVKAQVLVRREEDELMTLVYGNNEAVFPTSEVLSQWTGRATILGRRSWAPSAPAGSLATSNVGAEEGAVNEEDLQQIVDAFSNSAGLSHQNAAHVLGLLGGQGRTKNPSLPHLDDIALRLPALCHELSRR